MKCHSYTWKMRMLAVTLSCVVAGGVRATEVNVPENSTQNYDAASLVGSAELRKTGLGTLTLTGSGSYTGGATIEQGTVVAAAAIGTTGGATTDAGIFGTASTVTILDGGKFDQNQKYGFKNFTIAGAGPDGTGALGNWSGTYVGYANGGIPTLTLAADATLGGTSWMCVSTKSASNMSYVNMAGHTLSILTTPQPSDAAYGGFVFAKTTFQGGGEVEILNGGRMDLWSSADFGTTAVTVGEGGAIDISTKNMSVTVPTLTLVNPTASTLIGNAANWTVGTYVFSNTTNYATFDVCKAPLGASTKFVKAGSGDFSTGNADNSTLFQAGIEVREGCLVNRATTQTYKPFGPQHGSIEVKAGATFDVNGANLNSADYYVTIAGDGVDGKGAIQNTGTARTVGNSQMIGKITLADDASVGGTKGWSLTVSGWKQTAIELNGHTLTKKGDLVFGLTQTAITSTGAKGTLRVAEGTLYVAPNTTTFENADLVVANGATLEIPKYNYEGTEKPGALVCGCDLVCEPGATITGERWTTDTTITGDFVLDLTSITEANVRNGKVLLTCDLANAPKALTIRGATSWGEYFALSNETGLVVAHPLDLLPVLSVPEASDMLYITNNNDCVYSGTLSGVGTIVKRGTGTLTLTQDSQNTFKGTIIVEEGTLAATHRYAFGDNYTGTDLTLAGIQPGVNTSTVIARAGARVIPRVSNVSTVYSLVGAGPDGLGVILAEDTKTSPTEKGIESLTLAADATIGVRSGQFTFTRSGYGTLPITFGGHTLSIVFAENHKVWLSSAKSMDEGTVRVSGTGTLVVNKDSDLSTATLAFESPAALQMGAALSVSNLTNAGTVSGSSMLTVQGTLAGALSVRNLTLGDGAIYKPFTVTDKIAVGTSLTLGGRLTIDLSAIQASLAEMPSLTLLTGAGDLTEADIVFTPALSAPWQISKGADGSLLITQAKVIEDLVWNIGTATWAFNTIVNTNDTQQRYLFDSRHNITFVDGEANSIVTVPESRTVGDFIVSNETTSVTFAGEASSAIKATNSVVFAGAGKKTVDVLLRTEVGPILAQEGETVLAYASYPKTGWQILEDAALGFRTYSNEVWRIQNEAHLMGTGRLFKEGTGELRIVNENPSFVGTVDVCEGVLVAETRYALGPGGAGNHGTDVSTVRVQAGAAFVHAGENFSAEFELEGTGPDGNGALRNTTSNEDDGKKGVEALTLTDDALIKATGKGFPITRSFYQELPIDLAGHTLTLAGTKFWMSHAKMAGGGKVVLQPGVTLDIFGKTNYGMAGSDFGDSEIELATNTTLRLTAPFTVSNLTCYAGATITGGNWPNGLTVNGDFTLDLRPYFAENPTGERTRVLTGAFNNAWTNTIKIVGVPTDVEGWTVEPTADGIYIYNYLILSTWQPEADETMPLVVTGAVTHAGTGTILGTGTLVKDGTGTLTVQDENRGFKGTFAVSNGVLVARNRYSLGENYTKDAATTVDGVQPGTNVSTVIVAEGAQVKSVGQNVSAAYVLAGAGPDGKGALWAGFDATNGDKGIESLTLADDATIGAQDNNFAFVRTGWCDLPVTFNGHTLTLQIGTDKTVWTTGLRAQDAGTLRVSGTGTFVPIGHNSCDLRGTSLVLDEGAAMRIEGMVYAGNVAADGDVSGENGVLYLDGALTGAGAIEVGTIVLGTNAVLSLRPTAPKADVGVRFEAGVETVPVVLPAGGDWLNVRGGTVVLAWESGAGPLRGELVPSGTNARSVKIVRTETGYVVRHRGFVITFDSRATAATVPTPAQLSLRVAGYNVLHEDAGSKGNPDDIPTDTAKINHPWSSRKDDVVTEINNLACDVLCTQEMSANQRAYVLEHASVKYAAWGTTDGPATPANGASNHVLWRTNRFDCVAQGMFYMGSAPEMCVLPVSDALSRTCAWVVLRVKATGREFAVVSTHLPSDQTNVAARERAFGIICHEMEKLFPASLPRFLIGDYNTCLGKPELGVLDAQFASARSLLAQKGGMVAGPHRSCNSFITKATLEEDLAWTTDGIAACDAGTSPEKTRWYYEPIDHIYCHGDVSVTAMGILNTIFPTFTPQTYASDHNAYYADLVVR